MRKIFILPFGFALLLSMQVKDYHRTADTITAVCRLPADGILCPLKPPYIEEALVTSLWTDNWLVQAVGGTTIFLGKLLGCDDLLGRMKPAFSVSIGKWLISFVGGRLNRGGIQFSNYNSSSQDYQYLRTDFM